MLVIFQVTVVFDSADARCCLYVRNKQQAGGLQMAKEIEMRTMSKRGSGSVLAPMPNVDINDIVQVAKTRDRTVAVQPPAGTQLALNFIVHVFVLFCALTLLFVFVVSKMERKTLVTEVVTETDTAVDALFTALDAQIAASGQQSAAVYAQLATGLPLLSRLQAAYATPDAATEEHNSRVLLGAGLAIAVLLLAWVVPVAVLARCGAEVRPMMAQIGFENLIVFAVVGAVEYAFFINVAAKYVPIMPSQLLINVVDALQTQFA
jgi:hypothetical protein